LHLSQAAKIIRREMFETACQFDGNFAPGCQAKAVPQSLLALISMILEGPSIDMQSMRQNVPASLAISQLVVFNSVKNKRDNTVGTEVHHSKKQETPLPLYIGACCFMQPLARSHWLTGCIVWALVCRMNGSCR
jgi:hypothetical protein